MKAENQSTKDVHVICNFDIILEGHLVNLSKSFESRNCFLCMQEMLISFEHKSREATTIEFFNKRSKIKDTCTHITQFRRLRNMKKGVIQREVVGNYIQNIFQ